MRTQLAWRAVSVLLAFSFLASSIDASGEGDQQIQTSIQKALRAYSLTVLSSVQDGSVTLSGRVHLCRDRLLAVEIVNRIHGVKAILDRIEVDGPRVPDSELKSKIDQIITGQIRKLGGFGFGSMRAKVHDGVVTLSGAAAAQLASPTIAQIADIVGVKDLSDQVHRVQQYETKWPSPVTIRVQ